MKRPARIRIVGKQHRLDFVPASDPDLEGDLVGCIDHDKQRIAVMEGQPLEAEQDTVLHEVMHGVEKAMDLQLEETAIRRLATGLLAVIKDNPSFLAYLRKREPR